MLVLARKKGQSVQIGSHVRVVVLEASKDFVRLGIEAPPEVAVYRSKIYAAICAGNAAAVTSKKALAGLAKGRPAGQE